MNLNSQYYIQCIFKSKRKGIQVVRPLLGLNRSEIKNFILFLNIPIYPDKTNEQVYYARNRIRKQLLPAIRFFFNPKIENSLFKFTEITSSEDIYIESLISKLKKKNTFLSLNNKRQLVSFSIIKKPKCFQRQILKLILEKRSKNNIKFIDIEKVISLAIFLRKTECFILENNTFHHKKTSLQHYKIRKQKLFIFFPKIGIIINTSKNHMFF